MKEVIFFSGLLMLAFILHAQQKTIPRPAPTPAGFFMTANFSPGFTNIYKGDTSAPPNVKAHTQMFGVSIGYGFGVISNE